MRQAIALVDNRALNRAIARSRDELEERVEQRTAELLASELRFRSLVQNASDIVTVVSDDLTVLYQSPSAQRVLGYAPDELVGRRFNDLVHPDDREPFGRFLYESTGASRRGLPLEARIRHSDGSWHAVEVLASDHRGDRAIGGFILNGRDITDRQALEEELRRQAFHDPLTGLANRALLNDRLTQAIGRGQAQGSMVAVVFIDLDDFKSVNDGLGHPVGDELLRTMAGRLTAAVPPGTTVARFGGDEFVILLEGGGSAGWVIEQANLVHAALKQPVDLGGTKTVPRMSIGIALGEGAGSRADELFRRADVAMYAAKAKGKDRIEVYDAVRDDARVARLELLSNLESALDDDQLSLRFQPLIDLRSGEMYGAEALVRWEHPVRGLVSPVEFIPLAEECGLIVPIGEWVLREACQTLRQWETGFPVHRSMKMSVNVSGRQIFDPAFPALVRAILRETRVDPARVILELTETSVVQEDAARVLDELRATGVLIAIDDFGTGYSSLSYLKQLPVDVLKIDRSFIADVATPGDGRELVRAILRMVHTLRIATVAEGIETQEQLASLLSMGCEFGQGYLFAKPLSRERIEEMLGESGGALRLAA